MSVLAITYSFSPDTTIFSSEVNQNFNDVAIWANGHITQENLATFTGGVDFSLAGSDHALSIATSSSVGAVSISNTGPSTPFTITDTGVSGAIPAFKIASTTRGSMPMPVMSGAQRTAISSPPDGLMVFDTDDEAPYWYADGAWHFPQSSGVNNRLGVVNTTTDYTALATDNVIEADATSNDIDITLPAATTVGLNFTVIRMDDAMLNTVTILGTVGGITNPTLRTQQESVQFVSNGTDWDVMSHSSDTPWLIYTPSNFSVGSTSASQFSWRRQGSNLEVRGDWQHNGAPPATTAIVSLPPGPVIDDSIVPSMGSGYSLCGFAATSTNILIVLGGSSDVTFEFCDFGVVTPANASLIFGSTARVSMQASFPIKGWR